MTKLEQLTAEYEYYRAKNREMVAKRLRIRGRGPQDYLDELYAEMLTSARKANCARYRLNAYEAKEAA